jgi:periplasmic protein TonB
MGLMEFLRQWQRGRLAAGVAASVAIHLALIAMSVWVRLPASRYDVRRGASLIVELPKAEDSPPAGRGGMPVPRPSAPPAPTRATPAPPTPQAPRAVAKAPSPAEPVQRPQQPEPARRVESPMPAKPSDDAAVAAPQPAASKSDASPAAEGAPSQPAPQPVAERQVASLPTAPSPPGRGTPDILTALRRGPGGAGGSGDGRVGLEGEPIPLDSTNPNYSDYLDQIRRRIKEKWGFPCVKNESTHQCEYKTTQLVIEFGIAKDGKVPFVTVLRSSGYPIYDDYAVNAVKLASPFPRIPDTFSKTGVPIHATFSYVVEASLANILR